MVVTESDNSVPELPAFLRSGGAIAHALWTKDWTTHPLGHPKTWSPLLQSYIHMMLQIPGPAVVSWGPELSQFYNESYLAILGGRHPEALGQSVADCWPDKADRLQARLQAIMQGDVQNQSETLYLLPRAGFVEECFFSAIGVALMGDDGRIQGVMQQIQDVTAHVLSGRRKQTLEALSQLSGPNVLQESLIQLQSNPSDIPCALIYSRKKDGSPYITASDLRAHARLEEVLDDILADGTCRWIKNFQELMETDILSPWQQRVTQAYAMPFRSHFANGPHGILLLGISPHHPFRGDYQDFFTAIGRSLSTTLEREQLLLANEAARRMAEDQKRWLEEVLHMLPVGMSICDAKTGVQTFANHLITDLFGGPVPNLHSGEYGDVFQLHNSKGQLLSPSEYPVARATRGERLKDEVIYWKTPKGNYWLSVSSVTVPPMHGHPETVLVPFLNITTLKETELAFKRSEERYKLASLATRESIWDWDLLTNDVLWNDALCTEMGHSEEHRRANARWWAEHIHPEDRERVLQGIRKVIAGSDYHWQDEYRFLKGDGTYAFVLDRGFVSHNEEGRAVRMIGAMQDLSRERQVIMELHLAKEQAETANITKSRFLANMSHEIRTPLGIVLGYSEFLMDGSSSEADHKHALQSIHRNAQHLFNLVNEILDLSKIEAQKLEVERVSFDFHVFMKDLVEVFAFKAKEKAIDLQFRFSGPEQRFLLSDPTRLRQILTNVIGNAVKFTERGGVSIVSWLENLHDTHEAILNFMINDTGIGLSPEQQTKIWEPFVQADNTMTRRFGGTGLGLALAKHLAQALGGDLELVASDEMSGSSFSLKVKVGLAPELPKADVTTPPVARFEQLGGMNILVVEDSPDNQVLITRILKKEGARVTIAVDGHEGVEKAFSDDFDLILMDMQMPRLDGMDAMLCLRRLGFNRPIVALTAHAMTEERERSLRAGFDEYLTKPIDRRLIVERLATFKEQMQMQ